MNKELLKQTDELIMKFWKAEGIDNETKNNCVKKLQEVQMILQGEKIK